MSSISKSVSGPRNPPSQIKSSYSVCWYLYSLGPTLVHPFIAIRFILKGVGLTNKLLKIFLYNIILFKIQIYPSNYKFSPTPLPPTALPPPFPVSLLLINLFLSSNSINKDFFHSKISQKNRRKEIN